MSFSELFFVKNKTYNRKKTMVVFFCAVLLISALFGRLVYLMIFDAAHYQHTLTIVLVFQSIEQM
jgi:prolipoprotein diacylglyceryltransferase